MRRLILLLILCATLPGRAAPVPKNLQPLPEVPPPSGAEQSGSTVEPEVTIVRRKEAKFEEYRIRGKLYMVKVTPVVGPTYYLVDTRGDGHFVRYDDMGNGFHVPRWVIVEF